MFCLSKISPQTITKKIRHVKETKDLLAIPEEPYWRLGLRQKSGAAPTRKVSGSIPGYLQSICVYVYKYRGESFWASVWPAWVKSNKSAQSHIKRSTEWMRLRFSRKQFDCSNQSVSVHFILQDFKKIVVCWEKENTKLMAKPVKNSLICYICLHIVHIFTVFWIPFKRKIL